MPDAFYNQLYTLEKCFLKVTKQLAVCDVFYNTNCLFSHHNILIYPKINYKYFNAILRAIL